MRDFLYGFGCGVGLSVLVAAATFWHRLTDHSATIAHAASAISAENKTSVPVTHILSYPDAAKKKLHLPKAIYTDPVEHVTAASTVMPSFANTTVTAVTNAQTGDTEIYTHRDALPWLAFRRTYRISAYYGMKTGHSGAVWRTEGTMGFMQVKALRFKAIGSADSDGSWYAGLGVGVRW